MTITRLPESPPSTWHHASLPERDRPMLPPSLEAQMRLFTMGAPLPDAFIERHEHLARQRLADLLQEVGGSLAEPADLVDDGWGDGMRVLRARVYPMRPASPPVEIRWHPGNFGWMAPALGGGWRLVRQEDFPLPSAVEALRAILTAVDGMQGGSAAWIARMARAGLGEVTP